MSEENELVGKTIHYLEQVNVNGFICGVYSSSNQITPDQIPEGAILVDEDDPGLMAIKNGDFAAEYMKKKLEGEK